MIQEQLPMGVIIYPQITKVPKGIRLVEQKESKKVCVFTTSGRLIAINIESGEDAALKAINKELRNVALTLTAPTLFQFKQALL